MKYTVALVLLLFSSVVVANQTEYPVLAIDQHLLKNAHAVVRLNQVKVNAENLSRITIEAKHAITILNENGDNHASFSLPKDDFRKIRSLKGYILDAQGNVIERIQKKEIHEINAAAGQSGSIDDTEILVYEATGYSTPFTLVYEYEMILNSTFLLPDWIPVNGYHQSVEKDIYQITVGKQEPLKIKSYNSQSPEPKFSDKGNLTYTWELENFQALEPISYSPPLQERVPYAHIKTQNFNLEGLAGKQETWSQFGEWIRELNQNRDTLKMETRQEVKDLIKNCSTDKEKIKTIYEYMQSKTRYVSVQLGVGGWQTLPANQVDETGYGDCKGLSNYTYALLKEAGIKANYTLIRAGSNARNIEPDFPKNQFNHVILMVPLRKDTVWLECTSQRMPCGYLGNFTDDRYALVIDENNSHLVKTPTYNAENNYEQHIANFSILPNGNAKVTMSSLYKAYEYDGLRSFLYAGKEKQERFLYNRIDFSDFELNSYQYEQTREEIPSLLLNLDLTVNNFASTMGSRLFVPINKHNQTTYVPKQMETRKEDIWIKRPYTEVDTTVYHIPEGFAVESLPETIELEEDFGKYRLAIEMVDQKVQVIREMQIIKGIYPASNYDQLRTFYKKINQADRGKFVLVENMAAK
jgi:hypothetical protein